MPRARGQRPQRTAHRAAARTSDAALRVPQQAVALGADRGAPIPAHTKGGQGVAVPPTIDNQGASGAPREAAPGAASPPATSPADQVRDAEERLKKQAFLEAYAKIGNVTYAAKASRVHRTLHYRWLKEDLEYPALFAQAAETAIEVMEGEALRRAVTGIDKPIYFQGKKIDTIKEYSDVLLIFLLKGARPERYRDRVEHAGPGGGPIPVQHDLSKLPADKLLALREILTTLEGPPLLTGGEGVRRN